MTFALLTAIVAAAAFAGGWSIGVGLLSVRPWHRRIRSANAIFALGIAPLALATAATVLFVIPAFLLYEPRATTESAGWLVVVAAAVGVGLFVRTIARIVRMLLLSRRMVRDWGHHAQPLGTIGVLRALLIDTGHPVVAVAGFRRAALYIDRRVLAVCGADEIDAIAAHELAHVRSLDNVKRLLLGSTQHPHHPLVAAWRDAAERDADRFAAANEGRGLSLASALVKVARAGATPQLDAMAASSMHDGASIERRISALLEQTPPRPSVNRHPSVLGMLMLACLAPVSWRVVYDFVEFVINRLP
jgi:Zn-dependent protease with chaperone function